MGFKIGIYLLIIMAIRIKKWIGSNGEILIPLSQETYNDSRVYSTKGTYFIPITEEVVVIEAGNPMGLLLSFTYSATT